MSVSYTHLDVYKRQPAKLEIIKASEITPKEVRWLWYPYIPFGKVTLLQGDPGDGTSKLMLSLAALLSKGDVYKRQAQQREKSAT